MGKLSEEHRLECPLSLDLKALFMVCTLTNYVAVSKVA